jgi:hypothetical protein
MTPPAGPSGYSGTPLPRKLGITEDTTVLTVRAPDDVIDALGELPAGVRIGPRHRSADIALVFARTRRDMATGVERAMRALPIDGALWLCWPKKASGITSDLQRREVVMAHMDPLGLVDVKVAAITDVWSGLKFVMRLDRR